MEGEGERDAERDNCVPDFNRQTERGGMSEGWRSDTGCVNEHRIPTLSPVGTKEKTKKRHTRAAGSLDFGTT